MTDKKICFDRILPDELRAQKLANISPNFLPSGAAAPFRKLWANGSTINIRFMEGTAEQRDFVKKQSVQWTEHANLKFAFNDRANSEVRITFRDDGAWSYIGTDCLSIPRNDATMNFGWLDDSVVLHEFGHMIGLIHEHQNPVGGIQWNRDAVIRDLSGPPNFWDLETIEHNIFQKYDQNLIRGTNLDPESIMMYSFPADWTTNGFSTGFNEALSELDKQFIGGAEAYPKARNTMTELNVIETTQAEIGQPGEEDLFSFVANVAAQYTIETEGNTDVVMTLFGPDSQTNLIAQDDDGGVGRNSKIVVNLSPGKYVVQIRHFNSARGTGKYGIRVSK